MIESGPPSAGGPDPYAPPQAQVQDHSIPSSAAYGPVTGTMLGHLAATKPWVRFLSVLGLIGSGIMMLGGLGIVAVGVSGIGEAGLPAAGMGIAYLLFAALYVYPCITLWRFAGSIEKTLSGRNVTASLEETLLLQRTFWRFMGVFAVVLLCVYAAILVLVIAFGLLGSIGGR
jgi:hypothetical protein